MYIHTYVHTYICTYMHNWSLQRFSQDYDLASGTTYVVCVNFVYEWWDLKFKINYERQIFENSTWEFFFYSQRFCQNSAERELPKKYFFSYFRFDV